MRRLFSFLFALCVMTVLHAAVTNYDIFVCGRQVTSANRLDVMGDGGSVKYDPGQYTLTLKNANLSCSTQSAIVINTYTRIMLSGNNTVSSSYHGLYASADCSLVGENLSSSLDIKSVSTGVGFFAIDANNARVGITKCHINATSDYGAAISGHTYNGTSTLTITGSYVTAQSCVKGTTNGIWQSIANFEKLTFNESMFSEKTYKYDTSLRSVVDEHGYKTGLLKMDIEPENYRFYVNGVLATPSNKSSLLGDKTAKYDPATKTLTLSGVSFEYTKSGNAMQFLDDITVVLSGNNTISSASGYGLYVDDGVNVTFKGSSTSDKLTLTGKGVASVGVYSRGNVKIENCTMSINSAEYIAYNGKSGSSLTVDASNVDLKGARGAMFDERSLVLDGSEIVSPSGVRYANGGFFNASGAAITNTPVQIRVADYKIDVAGWKVTGKNKDDVLGDGKVVFDPNSGILKFSGANISCASNVVYSRYEKDLKVVFYGTNTFKTTTSNTTVFSAIVPEGKTLSLNKGNATASVTMTGTNTMMYFTGSGDVVVGNIPLKLTSGNASCKMIYNCAKSLTFNNADVTSSSSLSDVNGIYNYSGKLSFINSQVSFDYSGTGAMCINDVNTSQTVFVNNSTLKLRAVNGTPFKSGWAADTEGAYAYHGSNSSVKIAFDRVDSRYENKADGANVNYLCFAPSESYGIRIHGVDVCRHNMTDIFGDGQCYYNTSTNTIYLKELFPDDYNAFYPAFVINRTTPLTINVSGNNLFSCSVYTGCMKSNVPVTVTGGGKLTLSAIYCSESGSLPPAVVLTGNASLTVKNKSTLQVLSAGKCFDGGSVTVDNANLLAKFLVIGPTTERTPEAVFSNLSALNMNKSSIYAVELNDGNGRQFNTSAAYLPAKKTVGEGSKVAVGVDILSIPDVDGDGVAMINDVAKLNKMLTSNTATADADLDGNGYVNIDDLRHLINYLLRKF